MSVFRNESSHVGENHQTHLLQLCRAAPNRSHTLCSHGLLHSRCSHSDHFQANNKNNGNPIVHVSQRRCNGSRTVGDQHEGWWEVEQLLHRLQPKTAVILEYCAQNHACPTGKTSHYLWQSSLDPPGLQSYRLTALGQLFKPKLESSMNMNNTSCTFASIIYFDIKAHLS